MTNRSENLDFPLISVIIPVYNSELFLSRCLESIIHQTYMNLEIIIIDDGSTDASYNIIASYALKDTRIKNIRINNSGVSNARNIGVSIASGDYIIFVDSDDSIDSIFVEELYKVSVLCNSKIVTCESILVDEIGDVIETPDLDSSIITIPFFDYKYTMSYSHFVSWGVLYDSNIAKSLLFRTDLKVGEDTVYFVEAIQKSGIVTHLNKRLYVYTMRENSLSKGHYSWRQFDEIIAWNNVVRISKIQSLNSQISCKAARGIRALWGLQRYLKYGETNGRLLKTIISYIRRDCLFYLLTPVSIRSKVLYLFASLFPQMYIFLYSKYRI